MATKLRKYDWWKERFDNMSGPLDDKMMRQMPETPYKVRIKPMTFQKKKQSMFNRFIMLFDNLIFIILFIIFVIYLINKYYSVKMI